jgi:peptide/nickel transport system substrate-binding protein
MLSKSKGISTLFTILALAGLMVIFLGGSAFADEPKIAVYVHDMEPTVDWDPSVESSNGQVVLNNIYEALLRYDFNNKKIIPVLATEYSKSADGMSWTFKIRKGVSFHDGSELDAEAVKFSIERTLNIGKDISYLWSAVDKITVVDKYTVKIDLKYPASLDLIAASVFGSFIISPKAAKSHPKDWFTQGHAVGTGPYKLYKYSMGKEAILQAFDGYWNGWNKKRYDYVVVKKVAEPSARRQLLEKGEAVVGVNIPPEDIAQMKNNPDLNIHIGPSIQNLYVMLNTQKAPLNNKLARQAFAYAFPYEKVVKYAASGYAEQARGPIPDGLWGHSESLFQYSENLEKAKQLLKQANVNPKDRKLLFTYESGIEEQRKLTELYKSNLTKLGFKVEIRGMPWESMSALAQSTRIEDRQDIAVVLWFSMYPDPYEYLYLTFHTLDFIMFNLCYWNNSKFDQIIDQANEVSVVDRKKSIALYHQAQEMLIDESPAIFVNDNKNKIVTHKSLKGYKDNPAYQNVVFFHETFPE